jgi:hypothetical protein
MQVPISRLRSCRKGPGTNATKLHSGGLNYSDLLALHADMRLGFSGLSGTNFLTYIAVTNRKFIKLRDGGCLMDVFFHSSHVGVSTPL